MKVFKLRLENSLPRMLWKTSKQGKLVRNLFPCNPVTRSMTITEDLLQKGHYPRPIVVVVLQSFKLCPTLWDPMDCSTLGFPVLHNLLEFAQTHVHWISDAIQPPHPQSSLSPPALDLSQHQGLFQWAGSSHQVAKVLELQHQSGLISFRIDWFDLPAIQGTLKSLLQHHNSKALILQCSAFFMVQLSHLYLTTGKTIALTIWTFVSKLMSLLFNTLSSSVKPRQTRPTQT